MPGSAHTLTTVSTVYLGELGVVEQVGPMAMDEGAEGQPVPPAQVEVLDVDVLVGGRLALAPKQQALLGRHLLHRDVLDSEPTRKDDVSNCKRPPSN